MIDFCLLLVLTFLLDGVLGDPKSAFHPVALFGKLTKKVENICRYTFGNGIISGLIGWLILTLPLTAIAFFVVWRLDFWHHYTALFTAAFIGYIAIALRSLVEHAQQIRTPLQNGALAEAQKALSMIVSRDTNKLNESEVVRGGIESIGENLIDAVTSVFFWMFIGYLAYGLSGAAAGAVFLRTVNTLDACWGYKNEKYLYFGRIAAKIDDVIHFVPARLTLFAIAIGALLTGGKPLKALQMGIRHRADHPSPNSTYGMAGFAGALDLRLGGPTAYHGVMEDYPYWGDGRSELTSHDLYHAERLAIVSSVVFILILIGGFSLWQILFI